MVLISTKKTKLVRVSKKLDDELNLKFPGVRKSDLFDIMYNTSALKLESWLRNGKKKKKNGLF